VKSVKNVKQNFLIMYFTDVCSPRFFPKNATVAEYGFISEDVNAIMSEIYVRGPVAATVNGKPLHEYEGGIFNEEGHSSRTSHIVSIVGWGKDPKTGNKYWICRNSWGQYWGELGYFRIMMGSNLLGIESGIAWATPGSWTEINFPCAEDGSNCLSESATQMQSYFFEDPSNNIEQVRRRLQRDSQFFK